MAPGSFVDLLVNATDKATGESLSDLERTNQAFVMVMSGGPLTWQAFDTSSTNGPLEAACTLADVAMPCTCCKVINSSLANDACCRWQRASNFIHALMGGRSPGCQAEACL